MTRVLVIGGYGVFGRRIVARLARTPGLTVLVAGRDGAAAQAVAAEASAEARAAAARAEQAGEEHGGAEASAPGEVEAVVLDARALTPEQLVNQGTAIVIHTAGPFQGQDHRVAEAAIAAGAHYIDLADDRTFVCGIAALDAAAKTAGVLVTSGASSVPALAAAVVDRITRDIPGLRKLLYAISPGNSFDPGLATTEAILKGIGRPFTHLAEGRVATAWGWQSTVRRRVAGARPRLLGAWEVPDLDLFPARWPTLETQRFLAGVEVPLFHVGLLALSWLVRGGLLRQPERLAQPLLAAKRRLRFLGSDTGVMLVEAEGQDRAGRPRIARWRLVADEGHGPFVPGLPAVLIAKALVRGTLSTRGAVPCIGLIDIGAFEAEVADLAIGLHYAIEPA